MNFCGNPFARPEALEEKCVIATYYASIPDYGRALRSAGNFAVGQTTGTWIPVPGVTDDMIRSYQGRVLGVYDTCPQEECDKRFLIRIAFPVSNFGTSITQMMTALVGNDVSTSLRVRLVDVELSGGVPDGFCGPKKGMDQLREITGVYGRPVVLNMLKPCAGYTPEAGVKMFRQVALGGVDMVKDDELLGSPDYNEVSRRTALYLKEAELISQETGHRTTYVPNISGRPAQMKENIRAVIGEGAKACLVNYVFGGLDALYELNEEFGDQIFILAHYAGLSVMDSQDGGIGNGVYLGILARLAGAHGVMTMCPNPQDAAAMYDFYRTVQMQCLEIPEMPPVVTAVGGGITPVNQRWIQEALGIDEIIGIGGAIQGHPMGVVNGARAAMVAVEATAHGIPLEKAAESSEELKKAIELWS